MTQINQEQLLELLMGVEKSTLIHLVTTTPVIMNKTGNPYHNKVVKVNSCNYLIGNGYQDRVNSNISKEGGNPTFESQSLIGKEHVTKCVLKDTKTGLKRYLMVERFIEVKPKVSYLYEGNPIEKQLFESYMSKVSEVKTQPQDRKVLVTTPLLENIKEITLNKVQYEVIQ